MPLKRTLWLSFQSIADWDKNLDVNYPWKKLGTYLVKTILTTFMSRKLQSDKIIVRIVLFTQEQEFRDQHIQMDL